MSNDAFILFIPNGIGKIYHKIERILGKTDVEI